MRETLSQQPWTSIVDWDDQQQFSLGVQQAAAKKNNFNHEIHDDIRDFMSHVSRALSLKKAYFECQDFGAFKFSARFMAYSSWTLNMLVVSHYSQHILGVTIIVVSYLWFQNVKLLSLSLSAHMQFYSW